MDTTQKIENRASFFARMGSVPRENRLRIELAYTLAKFAHRAQVRKEVDAEGNPLRYFEHPRRVAIILMDEVGTLDPDLIISALLHDGVEDTRDLTPEMIEFHFGAEVARIVTLLSKVPKEGYLDRLNRYGDWKVYLVKACDRLDNLRSMGQSTAEFTYKQQSETRKVYYPLFNRMIGITPHNWQPAVSSLITRLIATCEALPC